MLIKHIFTQEAGEAIRERDNSSHTLVSNFESCIRRVSNLPPYTPMFRQLKLIFSDGYTMPEWNAGITLTAMQKNVDVVKSLDQTSPEKKKEHLIQITSLSEDTLMSREKFAWQDVTVHEGIDEVRAVQSDPRAEDEKTSPCTRINHSIKRR